MKASDLLVKSLVNEGVKCVFAVPGEENLDVLESLRKSDIDVVVTRHEQGAGFMAATQGRLTGKPGVALSTLGPGATNLVTPAAYASLGGMPMLMLTGQKPVKESKQGRFQILNTVEIMEPLTKYDKEIVSGKMVPSAVREAFRNASEERPGPVHIVLPEDIAKEDVDKRPIPITSTRRPVAEEKAINKAVEMIEQAEHPLILVGAGANRKRTCNMLRQFVDKTGIPFFDTQMGKGVVDERSDLYLGTAAVSSGDYVHCAIEHADLIINVGHDVIEKPPFVMERNGKKVIHINFYSAQVDEVYFPQHEVVGDIANAIWQIMEKIKVREWDFSYFMKMKEKLEVSLKDNTESDTFPIKPQRLVHDTRQVVPKQGILTLDNGMYKLWFARNYRVYEPNTILLDNALATMGAGLPSAIAAKIIRPGQKVIAVVGDGGFLMNSQEMETAVRLGLDLVIVIVNDAGYGMIKWKQKAHGYEDFGLDFGNPDFVKLAESYGAAGHRISSSDEFSSVLKKAMESKGVHIIDVPVDYSENTKVFTEEMNEDKC